jgi:2-oxoisovalerate dehydrogenase E2 component (dihydrolipoyl transacylase)
MSTTIVMPQLGESVAEGVIGKWLKQEGDQIEKDEPIVEVITDKVNAEIPSPVAGKLVKLLQPEGATVTVGEPIAEIGGGETQGSDAQRQPAGVASGNGASSSQTVAPTPVAERPSADMPAGMPPQAQQAPASRSQASANPAQENGRGERVRSSPLVRRLAEQYSISLSEVPGTGIGGRVSKQDIMSFIEGQQTKPAATAVAEPEAQPAAPAPAPARTQPSQPAPRHAGANEELVPISPLRKMIAERMVQSKFTIPHAMTVVEVDMTNCVRYREGKKDEFRKREGVPLSFVAFVIKATVEALKQFPIVNAEWGGDNVIMKRDININVAVDAPEGLTTPVIHHADERSLAGLSKAIYDLAVRAREKKLKIEDMQGGTFTVNNTGALGSVNGVSIINYPQAGILSAAAIVKRPVVLEGDGGDVIAVRSMMNLPLSFDHRLIDGGTASAFLNLIKGQLEAWPMDYPLY